MKHIALTTTNVCMVDDEDYDFLMQWDWYARKDNLTIYAQRIVPVNGVRITLQMHRVILEHAGYQLNGLEVDHGDRNGLNNQRYNLQAVTPAVNAQRAQLRCDNTSEIRGVNYDDRHKKWHARLTMSGLRIHVGWFDTKEEAATKLESIKRRYGYGKARDHSISS